MNCLIVVAHPDDEVLGAGGFIYTFTNNGGEVSACIMCMEALARVNRPNDDILLENTYSAMAILGIKDLYKGSFPNIMMNTIAHLNLVQFIEKAILESKPDIIITHHPSDLNNDHVQTSLACQAAIRLFQRRRDVKAISNLLYMEVPSSTDWSINTAVNRFYPNTFVEIGEKGIDVKLEALSMYEGVMRDYPHPRSDKALRALAAFRGAQSGQVYAEAFESVFRRVRFDI